MIPQIRKILYATDLTRNSAYAFFYAVDMATKHQASIIILHTIEPNWHYADEVAGSQLAGALIKVKKQAQEIDTEEIKKRLQQFCKRTEAQFGAPCVDRVSKILVPLSYPVEEILKVADGEDCDVIILGTHGKGVLKQTFLGSVSKAVLERTRKPVYIIPLPSEKTDIDWDRV